MDLVHEDSYVVFVRADQPHDDWPERAERPLAVCASYGDARRAQRVRRHRRQLAAPVLDLRQAAHHLRFQRPHHLLGIANRVIHRIVDQRRREADNRRRDMAAERVIECRGDALVWDIGHVNPGGLVENLPVEMMRSSDAGGAIRDLAWATAQQSDELRKGSGRDPRMHEQPGRIVGDRNGRGEIVDQVERTGFVLNAIDRLRARNRERR